MEMPIYNDGERRGTSCYDNKAGSMTTSRPQLSRSRSQSEGQSCNSCPTHNRWACHNSSVL